MIWSEYISIQTLFQYLSSIDLSPSRSADRNEQKIQISFKANNYRELPCIHYNMDMIMYLEVDTTQHTICSK